METDQPSGWGWVAAAAVLTLILIALLMLIAPEHAGLLVGITFAALLVRFMMLLRRELR